MERDMFAISKRDLAQLIRVMRGCKDLRVTGSKSGDDIKMRIVRISDLVTSVDEIEFQSVTVEQ